MRVGIIGGIETPRQVVDQPCQRGLAVAVGPQALGGVGAHAVVEQPAGRVARGRCSLW